MPRTSLMISAVLLLCIGSPSGADDKDALPVPGKPIKREMFRYDGRSFELWQAELLTELKVERKIKALEAIAEFADKGYGAEAAVAILEIMSACEADEKFYSKEIASLVEAADRVILAAGKLARPALLRALEGTQRNRKGYALNLLGSVDYPRDIGFAVAVLTKLASDKDEGTRNRVIAVFARRPDAREAAGVIRQALKDGDRRYILGQIQHARADISPFVADIEKLAADKDQNVREAAVKTLAYHLASSAVVEAMRRLLQEGNRSLILQHLEKQEFDDLIPDIAKLATDADEKVRSAVINLLANNLRKEGVVPELVRVMKQGDVAVRTAIVEKLPWRGRDNPEPDSEVAQNTRIQSLPLYFLALRDKNASVRLLALQHLYQGSWQNEEAEKSIQPALVQLLTDPSAAVQQSVLHAFTAHGNQYVVPELLDVVRRTDKPARARVTAIAVLRKESAENKDVIEVLSAMTKDKHPEVRQAAEEFNAERQRRLEQRKKEEE